MLSEGKRNKELIKCGLMVEENQILSFVLILERSYARAIAKSGIRAEEYTESMSDNGVTCSYPLFLSIFLIFVCHKCLRCWY